MRISSDVRSLAVGEVNKVNKIVISCDALSHKQIIINKTLLKFLTPTVSYKHASKEQSLLTCDAFSLTNNQ